MGGDGVTHAEKTREATRCSPSCRGRMEHDVRMEKPDGLEKKAGRSRICHRNRISSGPLDPSRPFEPIYGAAGAFAQTAFRNSCAS